MFIWDFVADTILGQIVDWIYGQVMGFLGNFFAEMGNMGVELFELSWVQRKCQGDRPQRHQGLYGGEPVYGCADSAL